MRLHPTQERQRDPGLGELLLRGLKVLREPVDQRRRLVQHDSLRRIFHPKLATRYRLGVFLRLALNFRSRLTCNLQIPLGNLRRSPRIIDRQHIDGVSIGQAIDAVIHLAACRHMQCLCRSGQRILRRSDRIQRRHIGRMERVALLSQSCKVGDRRGKASACRGGVRHAVLPEEEEVTWTCDIHRPASQRLLVRIAVQPHTIQKVHLLGEPRAVDPVRAGPTPEVRDIEERLGRGDQIRGCRIALRKDMIATVSRSRR